MGTILTGAVVALLAGLAVRTVIRDRAKGKGCGGCSGCSVSPVSPTECTAHAKGCALRRKRW